MGSRSEGEVRVWRAEVRVWGAEVRVKRRIWGAEARGRVRVKGSRSEGEVRGRVRVKGSSAYERGSYIDYRTTRTSINIANEMKANVAKALMHPDSHLSLPSSSDQLTR